MTIKDEELLASLGYKQGSSFCPTACALIDGLIFADRVQKSFYAIRGVWAWFQYNWVDSIHSVRFS